MTAAAAYVCVTLLIAAIGISGIVLLAKREAVLSGAALAVGALLGMIAMGAHVVGAPHAAEQVLRAAATQLVLPVAALTYPRWLWRRPVDFVASVTVVAAGGFAVLGYDNPGVSEAMGATIALTVVLYLWWRIETAEAEERTSLQWLAVTLGTAGLSVGLVSFAFDGTDFVLGPVLALLAVPIAPAMVVGVLRPDLLDVRGLLVWGVVTFVSVIVYLALFAGVVSAIDGLGGEPSPGALGLIGAVLAMGFHPTFVLLRGVVDQLLFGDRPDPLQAATHVADQIGDDPVLALRAVREALVLPYASLRVDGRELATSGTAVTHTRTLPLRFGEDAVGEIVVGLRAGDLTLAASDADVLRIVAPLLAQTLRAQALARDVRTSRNAAITAIEEERRRLRRDLHDGLGPTLSGVAFSTDAARNQLSSDPAAADALLEKLRADTTSAIAEVRRLVEGLRPPALDELGLLGAVRQHAATLHADGGAPLQVTIAAPEPLPELSAAAEVTAYRIVVEALTNVARHAAATTAAVELSVAGDDLRVSVQDDGRGSRTWRPGVGMSSMRERAEQVGGTLSARSRADGGRVEARIPLGTR
jgi:signal transduction histidine kinase